jgi:hypothetical protein
MFTNNAYDLSDSHSMGATMFYIAAASHPELNEKIDLMIGLAPVASMAHFSSPVKALAPHVDVIQVNKIHKSKTNK